MRILIANRGEIARRVIRTAHRLGHTTVAAYADPDATAPFVAEATIAHRLGPAALDQSYLSVDALLAAAAATGADAVHPGYGFLSENATFARAVVDAGMVWIGPRPEAIDAMGSKIEARRLATAAGVPIIPGRDDLTDDAAMAAAADDIGYPVLLKAAAGGGGKGIRIAHGPDGFADALDQARTEARRSFGDDAMIVERFVQRPRHVEVQVVGDRHGTVIDLGTRECSVQRRYQKVLEEAPAPNLPEATSAGLRAAAVALASAIGYDSTGTVEFVVDGERLATDPDAWYFLEMNTRLQVEHPVTEEVTGLDLVELQLRVAAGEPLPLGADDVVFRGHAFEARINAEDATRGFVPQTGTVTTLAVPDGVRWDSAVDAGSEITPHYDPMIAKLIVHGGDRATALRRLTRALDELIVGGVVTNAGFHRWLVGTAEVVAGTVTTRFLDEADLPSDDPEPAAAPAAARAWVAALDAERRADPSPWAALRGFRIVPHPPTRTLSLRGLSGEIHDLTVDTAEPGPAAVPAIVDLATRTVAVNLDGASASFTVLSLTERHDTDGGEGAGRAGAVVAPFPALVTEVHVEPGATVSAGDTIVTIEAMKMLHPLTAAGPGTVDEVRVGAGDQVVSNQILVTFVTDASPDDQPEPAAP